MLDGLVLALHLAARHGSGAAVLTELARVAPQGTAPSLQWLGPAAAIGEEEAAAHAPEATSLGF